MFYAVIDSHKTRYQSNIACDQWGHIKLYASEAAAKRRASDLNNAVFPKMDRWSVLPVSYDINY